jgi:hypothetical protein
MSIFRISYHTTGGSFSRDLEAETIEAAEKAAWEEVVKSDTLLRFTENEVSVSILTHSVVALSIKERKERSGQRIGFGQKAE